MSVPKHRRNPSSVEFDNTYYSVYDDAMTIIENAFGASAQDRELHADYIAVHGREVMTLVTRLLYHIRIANSIYPTCQAEKDERRLNQDKAIGICYTIMTVYQLVMHRLKTPEDKYTTYIKDLIHEINCLKSWRTSDNKRFGSLG